MESLKSKVKTIETALHDSDRSLQSLEDRTRTGIGTEVKGILGAITEGDRKIEHVRSEVKTLLKAIENESPDSVDLEPQLSWLSPKVEAVVDRFKTAESHADAAIEHAMSGQSQIIDVGQRVEVNKSQLELAQLEGERLASDAESQLRTSERQMEDAQARIEAKEREIQRKTWQASSLRTQKTEFEEEAASKRRAAANAELEAKKNKAAYAWGVVCCHSPEYLRRTDILIGREPPWHCIGSHHRRDVSSTYSRRWWTGNVSSLTRQVRKTID